MEDEAGLTLLVTAGGIAFRGTVLVFRPAVAGFVGTVANFGGEVLDIGLLSEFVVEILDIAEEVDLGTVDVGATEVRTAVAVVCLIALDVDAVRSPTAEAVLGGLETAVLTALVLEDTGALTVPDTVVGLDRTEVVIIGLAFDTSLALLEAVGDDARLAERLSGLVESGFRSLGSSFGSRVISLVIDAEICSMSGGASRTLIPGEIPPFAPESVK